MQSICSLLLAVLIAATTSITTTTAQLYPRYIDAHPTNGAWIQNRYNYTAPPGPNAWAKCVLINTVMDESGSMETEQQFLSETALPQMASELYSDRYGYDYVFQCSHGFGRRFHTDGNIYRYIGCSLWNNVTNQLSDPAIDDWYAVGKREDGYVAIQRSIYNVSATITNIDLTETCLTMDKNMIMATDEVCFCIYFLENTKKLKWW